MARIGFGLTSFVLVWFISLFEKKRRRKYRRGKNSRGIEISGKRPSGEKT